MISSTTTPRSTLKKKHNVLAYHRTRKAMTTDIINFRLARKVVNWDYFLTKALTHYKFYLL